MSTQAWLEQLKLEDGALLLRQGRLIKEVAHELGFRHATHFSRAFHRVRGVSPTAMRA